MTEREKQQIEEMADEIRRIRESYFGQADYLFAMKMYEAGYRKQSEGEWDDSIIGFCNVCKVCGAIVERSAIKNNSGKLNFCPNCGARMKGGTK